MNGNAAKRQESAAGRAVARLEERCQHYELALLEILDAVDLRDAQIYARRAISTAHFGPVKERGSDA